MEEGGGDVAGSSPLQVQHGCVPRLFSTNEAPSPFSLFFSLLKKRNKKSKKKKFTPHQRQVCAATMDGGGGDGADGRGSRRRGASLPLPRSTRACTREHGGVGSRRGRDGRRSARQGYGGECVGVARVVIPPRLSRHARVFPPLLLSSYPLARAYFLEGKGRYADH